MVTLELLRQWEVFESLPDKFRQEFLEKAEIAPFAPGEVIIPAGQPFTFFGVVLEGEAKAYLPTEEGEPRAIDTMPLSCGVSLNSGCSMPTSFCCASSMTSCFDPRYPVCTMNPGTTR